MGATSCNGNRPMDSTPMTTAGRAFPISAPTDGSKFTVQTSPRFGVTAVAMQVSLSKSLAVRQIAIRAILVFGPLGGRFENAVSFVSRKLAQLASRPTDPADRG